MKQCIKLVTEIVKIAPSFSAASVLVRAYDDIGAFAEVISRIENCYESKQETRIVTDTTRFGRSLKDAFMSDYHKASTVGKWISQSAKKSVTPGTLDIIIEDIGERAADLFERAIKVRALLATADIELAEKQITKHVAELNRYVMGAPDGKSWKEDFDMDDASLKDLHKHAMTNLLCKKKGIGKKVTDMKTKVEQEIDCPFFLSSVERIRRLARNGKKNRTPCKTILANVYVFAKPRLSA